MATMNETNVVLVRGLQKRYGDRTVVAGLDLALDPGSESPNRGGVTDVCRFNTRAIATNSAWYHDRHR